MSMQFLTDMATCHYVDTVFSWHGNDSMLLCQCGFNWHGDDGMLLCQCSFFLTWRQQHVAMSMQFFPDMATMACRYVNAVFNWHGDDGMSHQEVNDDHNYLLLRNFLWILDIVKHKTLWSFIIIISLIWQGWLQSVLLFPSVFPLIQL